MTLADVEAHQRKVKGRTWPIGIALPKRSKFKNIRCQAADGTNFASKLERDYYEDLLLRWKAGDVLWFTRQVPFWLEGGVKFVVDFMVIEPGTPEVAAPGIRFVDTTGIMTSTKINKLKQLKARYGLDVEIVTK
jgi:hypothetical protein